MVGVIVTVVALLIVVFLIFLSSREKRRARERDGVGERQRHKRMLTKERGREVC